MLINIWGKSIWYEIYGAEYSGTLLYLHGGPGASCLDFANQARALSWKMKVVIFDQLGVLRSEAIAENESYSMEYQIEMIEEIVKKLNMQTIKTRRKRYGIYQPCLAMSLIWNCGFTCMAFLLKNMK